MRAKGFPTNLDEVAHTAKEAVTLLVQINRALQNSGGTGYAVAVLESVGAAALLASAPEVAGATVVYFSGLYVGCLVKAAGPTLWPALAEASPTVDVKSQILAAADQAGMTPPEGVVV
jgi:hypothetical protein